MFGDWISQRWDAATEQARADARAVYGLAESAAAAGRRTAEAIRQSAIQVAEATRRRAAELAEAARVQAAKVLEVAETAARNALRSDLRARAGAVADAAASIGRAGRAIGRGVDTARTGVENMLARVGIEFGNEPIGGTTESCPNCPPASRDGDFMIPNANGGCDPIEAQGTIQDTAAALEQARSSSVRSEGDCCKGKSAAERDRVVFYTNGIKTDSASHCATLKRLRDITCARVVGVLNDTEGPLTDALRTGDARGFLRQELKGTHSTRYEGFSPAVETLRRSAVQELLAGRGFEVFAHSEGGAITSLAMVDTRNTLAGLGEAVRMGQVRVTSMGSAAQVWIDGPKHTHLIHVNDTTPNLLGLADSNRHAGSGARVLRFTGSKADGFQQEPLKRPFAPTSPVRDHSVDDTYLEFYNEVNGGCG